MTEKTELAKAFEVFERMPVERIATPVSPTAALMEVIANAAMDPRYDLDRMERLFVMHREMEKRELEHQFDEAMSDAQAEMRGIAPDKRNQQTKSDFASIFAVDKAIRATYVKHGFAITFDTVDIEQGDAVRLKCHVTHKGGFARDYHLTMPADGKGAKGGDVMTRTHATGAAISYGQRNLLRMVFNLAIGGPGGLGEDDDGNGAGIQPETITAEQVDQLRAKIGAVGANEEKLLKIRKVGSLTVLPAKEFAGAMADLDEVAKLRTQKAKG